MRLRPNCAAPTVPAVSPPNAPSTERLTSLRLEYGTLREESAQARQAQQSTLQWSLAGIAALFAAGLVFSAALIKQHPIDLELNALSALFGLVIPGYSFCSAMIYVGELRRMERVGAFLRALEESIEEEEASPSLRWERFLRIGGDAAATATGRRARLAVLEKLSLPYLGGAGLYFGATAVSTLASFFLTSTLFSSSLLTVVAEWLPFVWLAAVVALFVVNAIVVIRTRAPRLEQVSVRWQQRSRP